jgi:protein-L-isoaspartate(D-aspartate) O-methyltransferase
MATTTHRFWVVILAVAMACNETLPPSDSPETNSAAKPGTGGPSVYRTERFEERRELFTSVLDHAAVTDERVREALLSVPRHRFVPADMSSFAYADRPLPIGHGQTISQPAVVAVMTAAVLPGPSDHCLEIGTGSGYQAAVLAELCGRVYSIEYVPELARLGEQNLRGAGYGPDRVVLRTGDGFGGWPEAAPFQVIVVTAAPEKVPEPLLEQLGPGGRLIIPVGKEDTVQSLELWRRVKPGSGADSFERQTLMPVRFVPFVGQAQSEN